jgi:hypothetical protein
MGAGAHVPAIVETASSTLVGSKKRVDLSIHPLLSCLRQTV